MKKNVLLAIVLLAFIGQSNVWAQEKGQIRAGAGLALGTKAATDSDTGESKLGVGITIGGDFFITDAISIAPNFTFFFKSNWLITGLVDVDSKISVLDIDGKYYFLKDAVGVYGLFGISIGFAALEGVIDFGGQPIPIDDSDSSFGVNIGGGADYYLSDKVFLNAQLKYNTPLEQLAINIGAGFNIN